MPVVPTGSGLFDWPHPWTTDVSALPKAATSDTIIAGLMAAGGWGQGNVFLTDASILILEDDGSAPTRTFTRTSDFYSPDCDTSVPGAGDRRRRRGDRLRVRGTATAT